MEYISKKDDGGFTTIRITKRIRRKLGMLTDGNKRPMVRLEEILDEKMRRIQ